MFIIIYILQIKNNYKIFDIPPVLKNQKISINDQNSRKENLIPEFQFNNNEEKPGENIEEIQVNRPNVTNIVKDKRKTNLVDREAILLKIMNQRNVIDETDKKAFDRFATNRIGDHV